LAFNFPNSPVDGTVYTPVGGPTYTYSGGVWNLTGSVVGFLVPDEVVGGMITIASTAPSSPAVNDVWIDTT
jgi:hypothetical protein